MKNKLKIIIAVIIVALVVSAYLVNNFRQDKNTFNYNGFKVYRTAPAVYDIEIFLKNDPTPHYISIRYDPRDLKDIEIEENLKERLLRKEIFVTLTPNLTIDSIVAVAELAKIIGNKYLFNIPVSGALTYPKDDTPIKTCSDVTVKTSIILLKLGEETKVYKDNECIIIEGKTEEDIVKAVSKLALELMGINN